MSHVVQSLSLAHVFVMALLSGFGSAVSAGPVSQTGVRLNSADAFEAPLIFGEFNPDSPSGSANFAGSIAELMAGEATTILWVERAMFLRQSGPWAPANSISASYSVQRAAHAEQELGAKDLFRPSLTLNALWTWFSEARNMRDGNFAS